MRPARLARRNLLRHRLPEAQRHLGGHRLAIGDAADAVSSEQLPAVSSAMVSPHLNHDLERFGRSRTTSRISATSWTRTAAAPPITATVTAAAVPKIRSAAGFPVSWPMNALRDTPTMTGTSRRARSAGSARSRARLCSSRLPKPIAGIDPGLVATGRAGRREPLGQLGAHLVDDVAKRHVVHHRGGRAAQVPEHDPGPCLGGHAHDLRIQPPARHVVDHRSARRDRRAGGAGLVGVDRDPHRRRHPPDAVHRSPATRAPSRRASDTAAAPGPRRLAADVDPVRPLLRHARARRDRLIDRRIAARRPRTNPACS